MVCTDGESNSYDVSILLTDTDMSIFDLDPDPIFDLLDFPIESSAFWTSRSDLDSDPPSARLSR
eukprot:10435657-Alexandrium_andersonii.AAC.1